MVGQHEFGERTIFPDIDPSQKILTSNPIRPGGRALRRTLQKNLFGAAW
jgi:hypothetical protein